MTIRRSEGWKEEGGDKRERRGESRKGEAGRAERKRV